MVLWHLPSAGVFKINVHSTFFAEHHCVGLGMMVRDCEGQAIAARSKKIFGLFSPVVVEAMAFQFALGIAYDLGLHSVEMEGDSVEVVNALLSNEALFSPFGLIIKDIQSDASQFFDVVSFSHIRHEGNELAHGFARHTKNVEDFTLNAHQTGEEMLETRDFEMGILGSVRFAGNETLETLKFSRVKTLEGYNPES
ncbi:hypothetical protein L1049_002825 [Liquidambar formosana]|uniref:RNase H type-1 domain-containing protein n=1 Tax=Liquidambar formosana TaxID=63359 RepID=A0AAP0NI82_LIQFO